MDNTSQQDFTQDSIYQGSRGHVDVPTMVVTYAVRAFYKLVREHGHSILNTSLVQSIARRAQLEGSTAIQVDAISVFVMRPRFEVHVPHPSNSKPLSVRLIVTIVGPAVFVLARIAFTVPLKERSRAR